MAFKQKTFVKCDCPDEELYLSEDDGYYDLYSKNAYYDENSFKDEKPIVSEVDYESIKDKLPIPEWNGHENSINAYNYGVKTAFAHIKHPTPENGLIRSYFDTSFNMSTFMSDSSSMMWYTKYFNHVYDSTGTLDNFYNRQHIDGFICREIRGDNGKDRFHRFDPASTGPLWFSFSEWGIFKHSGDRDRLKKIFPVLMGFHDWFKKYRTNPDGSYWYSGLSSTMDNQPRLPKGYSRRLDSGNMSWIDANLCAIVDAECLIKIAKQIGRENEVDGLKEEVKYLVSFVIKNMWDKKTDFFYDLNADGTFGKCKTIGAFWAMHIDAIPEKYVKKLVKHLMDPKEFNRYNPVPSISADSPMYDPNGKYWRGGVWSCTDYMVFSGLIKHGYYKEAYELAERHNRLISTIYKDTGTLWEVYAPDSLEKSEPSLPDYIGWAALSTISILFEFVFGIVPKNKNNVIEWHVNLTDKFGIKNYCFNGKTINLECEERASAQEEPTIRASGAKVRLKIFWGKGKSKIIEVEG